MSPFLIPILVSLGAFAMIFGIVYLKTRENMALIEKGINPKVYANSPAPYRSLKTGLLFLGAGLGLLAAYLIDSNMGRSNSEPIYFALIAIGRRWANVSNTPYQWWKMESYEVGVRSPCIAFWPKGITAKKGSFTDGVGHVMDFMQTFVELARAHYPKVYNGHKITPMQGISLAPLFKGKEINGRQALFNEHFGARYVRTADWKLVAKNNKQWHLYRINEDETELNDLSTLYPAKVTELEIMWKEWAMQNKVLPKTKGK